MGRRRVGGIVGLLVILGLVGYLLVSPPAALTALITGDRPSAVAGDAVPAMDGAPDVRIAVTGDTGTGTSVERATARRMAAEAGERPYDALLLLGDLVYNVGDAQLVDRVVTEPFAPVLDSGAQLLPVLGNHDYGSGEQQQILSALGVDASWYATQVGSVRILVLDSNRVEDPEQTRWLVETLTAPPAPGTWTIAAMHHPAYSAGHHGSDLAVREAWGPPVR